MMVIGADKNTRFEPTWGRKRSNSRTFISRVYMHEPGGGMEVWHCDHKHPTKDAATDCAFNEAQKLARADREAAARRPSAAEMHAQLAENLEQLATGLSVTKIEFK